MTMVMALTEVMMTGEVMVVEEGEDGVVMTIEGDGMMVTEVPMTRVQIEAGIGAEPKKVKDDNNWAHSDRHEVSSVESNKYLDESYQ